MSFDGLAPWPVVQFGPDAFAELANPDGFVDLLAEHERALREQLRAAYAREWDERWAEETRRYWSGPDRVQRQIARAFRVRPGALGLVPRSAFTGEYRRRQRARVKRRRR